MQNLSNSVLLYYLEHLSELSFDRQFHFASRLYLWSQHETLGEMLQHELKSEFTGNGSPAAALQAIVDRVNAEVSHGSKNAAELRRPYFEAYPKLKLYVSLLFRVLFLETLYGIDAREELFRLVPDKDLAAYESRLLADTEALAILSTHAVNYCYLYRRVIRHDETGLDPSSFLAVGRTGYDRGNTIHLQLLVYLYTHCILGESKFYFRRPSRYIQTYRAMLDDLTKLIDERFVDINLDNKCEYLVCCELLGIASPLQERIFAEAAASVSDEGTFLVDRHNNNPQTGNTTLDLSEHRNVLFILATLPFRPLDGRAQDA